MVLDIILCSAVQYIEAINYFIRIIIYKGAKNPVPNGKNISKICVGPWAFKVVMKLMHIWRNKKDTKAFIQPYGQRYIRMGHVRKKYRQKTIKQIKSQWRPQDQNDNKTEHFS